MNASRRSRGIALRIVPDDRVIANVIPLTNWNAMRLTERFRRLTIWNKLAVLGSMASIIAFLLWFLPSRSDLPLQHSNGSNSPPISIEQMNGSQIVINSGVPDETRLPTPSRSEDILTNTETKKTKFAFVSPGKPFGAESMGIVDGALVPVAYVEAPEDAGSPTYSVSGAYILGFKIQKRPEFPKIAIDQVRVVVHSWKKPPVPVIRAGAFPSETNLYLVRIGKPLLNTKTPFVAQHFYEQTDYNESEKIKFAPLIIDSDDPELIHVRVNAEDEGDYLISLEIEVSRDMQSETVELLSPTRIVFINPDQGPEPDGG